MTIFELAQGYYPHLWDDQRLDLLVHAGQLSREQVEQIKGGVHEQAGGAPL